MTYVRIVSKSATFRQQDVPPVFVAQKAEGRPVRIRMAPSTPKAGSSLVSRVIGVAEAEAEALALDAADDDDADEEVGVAVYVTLKVVGTTVVYCEFWPLVVVEVVIVLELVVSEREREAEDADDRRRRR